MTLTRTIELEAEISATIHKDNNCTVTFDYSIGEGITDRASKVSAYTFNPLTEEFFLLYTVFGKDKIRCLESLLVYVQTHTKEMSSYTVSWSRKVLGSVGSMRSKVNVSYFYGKNVKDVIDKFFAGKDPDMYYVWEIKLNPSA